MTPVCVWSFLPVLQELESCGGDNLGLIGAPARRSEATVRTSDNEDEDELVRKPEPFSIVGTWGDAIGDSSTSIHSSHYSLPW